LFELSTIPALAEDGTTVGVEELEVDIEASFLFPCDDVGIPMFPVVEAEVTNIVGEGGARARAVGLWAWVLLILTGQSAFIFSGSINICILTTYYCADRLSLGGA
jgi:hypothetical protein